MLSGPRRAQAGSYLPKNRPDPEAVVSKEAIAGPCGELATHFMGLLVCAHLSSLIFRMAAFLDWKQSNVLVLWWAGSFSRHFWFFSCRRCMGDEYIPPATPRKSI